MSACAELRPLLDLAPLAGWDLLEPAERAALDEHLGTCGACRDEAAALTAALAADAAAVEADVTEPTTSVREALLARAVHEAAAERKTGPGPLAVDAARLEAVGRRIALACSFCHGRTARDEVAFCAACLAPHHAECFAAHGRCALPGCEETATVRPQAGALASAPQAPAPPRARTSRRGRLIVLALALAGAGGALAARTGSGGPAGGADPLFARVVDDTARAARDLEAAARDGDLRRARALRPRLDVAPWIYEALEGAEAARLREHVAALQARADAVVSEPTVTLRVVDADLRRVVSDLARQAGQNVVVEPHIDERVTLDLRDVLWSEALRLVASSARCRVEPRGDGVLALTQPPRVSIQFTDANIRVVLQLLAAYSGKNVVIESGVTGNITLDLKEVPWDEALLALAASHRFHVAILGEVVLCSTEPRGGRPLAAPPPSWRAEGGRVARPDGPTVDLDVRDMPLAEAVAEVVRQAGQPVEVEGDLGAVTARLTRVPWRQALEALVSTLPTAQVLERGDGLVVRRRPQLSLEASDAPVSRWLQLLAELAGESLIVPETDAEVTITLRDLEPREAIEVTCHVLGWRLVREGAVLRVETGGAARSERERSPAPFPRVEAVVADGERRWAQINGRVYVPGDVLIDPRTDEQIEGLVLEAIDAEGVLLRRDGAPERHDLPRR
ncbi:MAG: hypothetical protein M9894_15180 [Planctomycetes bacterium]|nr:hypothetical protein [Planctomycetota bacterium]